MADQPMKTLQLKSDLHDGSATLRLPRSNLYGPFMVLLLLGLHDGSWSSVPRPGEIEKASISERTLEQEHIVVDRQ